MCGIAGLVNFDNSYIDSIKNSLYHRGPDPQTHFQHNNLHLIHTRLSIQDIKNGDQPYRIGQYVIIFNRYHFLDYNPLRLTEVINPIRVKGGGGIRPHYFSFCCHFLNLNLEV